MTVATTAFVPSVSDRADLSTFLTTIFPFVSVERSTLGGEHRASLLVKVSLDAKGDWANGIFHNSRYAMFHVNGGKVEMFSAHGVPKFRKANARTLQEAMSKIEAWYRKI